MVMSPPSCEAISSHTSSSSAHNSSALLITGVPLLSKGRGLAQTVHSFLAKAVRVSRPDSTSTWKPPKIKFSFNIHGHVRGGTCTAIFDSAADAEHCAAVVVDRRVDSACSDTAVSSDVREDSQECVYEGRVLSFDRCAGRIRDHLFPSLAFDVRRAMRLDAESTYSVTCELDAVRMGSLLSIFAESCSRSNRDHVPDVPTEGMPKCGTTIVDGMACAGGNTCAFMYFFDRVIAVEVDKHRHANLQFNTAAYALEATQTSVDAACVNGCSSTATDEAPSSIPRNRKSTQRREGLYPDIFRGAGVRCGCVQTRCMDILSALRGGSPHFTPSVGEELRWGEEDGLMDVLFMDPPWGGTDYQRVLREHGGDIPLLCGLSESDGDDNLLKLPRTVSDWILELCGCTQPSRLPVAPVVAWKLPAAMDLTDVARRLTNGPPSRRLHDAGSADSNAVLLNRERNFPFRFHFGAHTQLLVVAVAGNAAARLSGNSQCTVAPDRPGTGPRGGELDGLWFANSNLDALVARLHRWNLTAGGHECRPEMFDYDKQRWILLKKWIPSHARREEEA